MNKQHEQLDNLREIRSMMERSSRFISLNGLTGVIAGIAAIAGVIATYSILGISISDSGYYKYALNGNGGLIEGFYQSILPIFTGILVISLIAALWLSARKAKKQSLSLWDATAKRLFINLMIPLATGGVFCLILIRYNQIAFVAPTTLIFYGLALLNASKYTLNDIRLLGIIQIVIGLVAATYIEYGLLIWAVGFGIVHIAYGIAMYLKYEK